MRRGEVRDLPPLIARATLRPAPTEVVVLSDSAYNGSHRTVFIAPIVLEEPDSIASVRLDTEEDPLPGWIDLTRLSYVLASRLSDHDSGILTPDTLNRVGTVLRAILDL